LYHLGVSIVENSLQTCELIEEMPWYKRLYRKYKVLYLVLAWEMQGCKDRSKRIGTRIASARCVPILVARIVQVQGLCQR